MPHLLLVRHGQSTNNVIEAQLGDCPEFYQRRVVDPPLSALGLAQAEALGRHLGPQLRAAAAQGRVRVVCSSMKRAMQTAQPLAGWLDARPLVRPDCVERCGFFSVDAAGTQVAQHGPTGADVLECFPTFDASLLSASAEPTLETVADARVRAARVAAELLATARSGSWHAPQDLEAPELLVLVAHADFIGMLVRAILDPTRAGVPVEESAAEQPKEPYYDLNNTATVHLALLPSGRVRLLHWNRSDHLVESLRSGVAWKNMPGCATAAEWARHGEGGSGLRPLGEEARTVAAPEQQPRWPALAAAALAGVLVALLASRSAR